MTTLGEKVTETIVNALGKGVESAGMAQHTDLKAIVAPRVNQYLSRMDHNSPEYHELERLTSNTTIVDVILMLAGSILGVIQSLWTMGAPTAEQLGQASWQVKPAKLPPAQNVIVGAWRGAIGFDDAKVALKRLGFDGLAQDVIEAALRQPLRAEDILELRRRGYIDSAKMTRLLDGAGFDHEARAGLLQLQWRIPGVSDLIRMAVREAFTPEIAEKFGQYADFPPAFAEWALKQGLTTEWAQRYWAAHWELPSVNQGFEMLHRGVINQTDMELLLRAQDVMPFWRDKLTSIAYNPLTRVDVRRMYQLGIIDEAAVLKAYRDLGYNKENALRLTEFCKRYYGVEDDTEQVADREYTKSEILSGYRNGTLTGDQALGSLQDMGYSPDQAGFYLAQEDLKATQTLKAAYLARYQALYVAGILSADDVTTNLKALGIGDDEIKQNLAVWYLQRISQVQRPTKAELIRWLKAGIISQAIWESEMRLQGFSDRYISWYLAEISSQPAIAQQTEEVA